VAAETEIEVAAADGSELADLALHGADEDRELGVELVAAPYLVAVVPPTVAYDAADSAVVAVVVVERTCSATVGESLPVVVVEVEDILLAAVAALQIPTVMIIHYFSRNPRNHFLANDADPLELSWSTGIACKIWAIVLNFGSHRQLA
jgi:hypothetical protein